MTIGYTNQKDIKETVEVKGLNLFQTHPIHHYTFEIALFII